MTVSTDVALTGQPQEDTMPQASSPEESKFKTMLSQKMNEAKGRNTFTGTEVLDSYLDLWLALGETSVTEDETDTPEPVLA